MLGLHLLMAIDNEYVRGLQGAKSVSTASKRAYASTVEYLPGLIAVINDIGKLLQTAVERKVGLLLRVLQGMLSKTEYD